MITFGFCLCCAAPGRRRRATSTRGTRGRSATPRSSGAAGVIRHVAEEDPSDHVRALAPATPAFGRIFRNSLAAVSMLVHGRGADALRLALAPHGYSTMQDSLHCPNRIARVIETALGIAVKRNTPRFGDWFDDGSHRKTPDTEPKRRPGVDRRRSRTVGWRRPERTRQRWTRHDSRARQPASHSATTSTRFAPGGVKETSHERSCTTCPGTSVRSGGKSSNRCCTRAPPARGPDGTRCSRPRSSTFANSTGSSRRGGWRKPSGS